MTGPQLPKSMYSCPSCPEIAAIYPNTMAPVCAGADVWGTTHQPAEMVLVELGHVSAPSKCPMSTDLLAAAAAVRDAVLWPLDGCEHCGEADCASRCDYCGATSAGGQRCSSCGAFVCEIEAMYVGDAQDARGQPVTVGPSPLYEAATAVATMRERQP